MGSDEPPCHGTDEASSPAKWLKHCHVNLLGFMSEVGNTTLDSANCILRGTGVLALVNSVQFGNVSYIVIHHYASSCIIFHHIHLFSTYLNKIYTIYNSLKIFVMVSSDLSQTQRAYLIKLFLFYLSTVFKETKRMERNSLLLGVNNHPYLV